MRLTNQLTKCERTKILIKKQYGTTQNMSAHLKSVHFDFAILYARLMSDVVFEFDRLI